ncbi:unannotated protein [freshwater metagenome]|uniref:Unannotated protein n=1 Tax=freshwater metagenome TaxID=449393 RepID=A0A6J7KSY6_9ZZZZ|nr:hypothetical protein [Actinomycetota bacterium]MSW98847.1 hypothetical protein [Actinomycetota bacterium]MSY82447.1 hypothetical protein [Actinomycetota bacterium]MSZ45895.1 hypothetical protein [Actinomycetota bacterium]MTA04247.1 hypothetical protein [Actinomycetota bacterium]
MAIHKKRFFRFLRTIGLIALVVGSVYGLGWSNLISVKSIAYSGTSHAAVLESALQSKGVALEIGMPLARVDVRAIGRIAEEVGWIADSKISRNWWNGKVGIAISERIPVAAFADVNGSLKYFDAQGTFFSSPGEYAANGEVKPLPIITFSANSAEARKAAAEWVASMPTQYLATMTSIWVNNPERIVMKAVDPALANKTITVIWGGVRDMPLKVKVLRALLLRPENKTHHLFDLSAPLAPITR